MRKLIKVTEDDIRYGIRSNCDACPIARAASREIDRFVAVGGSSAEIGRLFCALPRSAMRFIRRFDNGAPVKPFNFYLEVPE